MSSKRIDELYEAYKNAHNPDMMDVDLNEFGIILDEMLIALKDVDLNLVDYIIATDGDELTDEDAIELIKFRCDLLKL